MDPFTDLGTMTVMPERNLLTIVFLLSISFLFLFFAAFLAEELLPSTLTPTPTPTLMDDSDAILSALPEIALVSDRQGAVGGVAIGGGGSGSGGSDRGGGQAEVEVVPIDRSLSSEIASRKSPKRSPAVLSSLRQWERLRFASSTL